MTKNNKNSPKNRPFNSSLFDGIAAIKKQQQDEAAAQAKAAKEAAARAKEAKKRAAEASGYHFDANKSDAELWAAYNGATSKLKDDGKRRVSVAPVRRNDVRFVDDDADVMAELSSLVNGEVPFYFDNSDEYQSGHINGVDERTMQDLRAGNFNFTDHIDLHGLTAEEAKKSLKRFLIHSRQTGHRCVLVVTGRGLNSPDKISVLRTSFAGWVSSGTMGKIVMAYCTALPHDGGPGAFYVLLRKNGERPFTPLEKEDSGIEEFAKLFGAD